MAVMAPLSQHGRWLAPLARRPQAELQMLCFPYGGGGPSVFRGWPERLPGLVEIYAVQLPGRGNRLFEPPLTKLQEAAEEVADALIALRRANSEDERPLVLFGHSLGALLAFEVARQLRRKSRICLLSLCCSGCRAPQLPLSRPPIHALPDAALKQELKELNGSPPEILENADLMELLLPALRADFAMAEMYDYRDDSPLGCPITLFGGIQDGEVSETELAAWQEQTVLPLRVHMLEGDHFFLNSASRQLLDHIERSLVELADCATGGRAPRADRPSH